MNVCLLSYDNIYHIAKIIAHHRSPQNHTAEIVKLAKITERYENRTMKDDDVVRNDLRDSHFSYAKVIFLISGIFGVFYAVMQTLDKTTSLYIIDIVFVVNPLVTSISAFVVAGLYKVSRVLGLSYLILGIGMLCGAIGEAIYGVQSVLMHVDPYPSIADGFFLAQSFFWLFHVIINLRYFKQPVTYKHVITFIAISVGLVSAYLVPNIVNDGIETDFEFYYGLIFVIIASILLPLFLFATIAFRGGMLGIAWNILLLGMTLNVIGDVWYYNLESQEMFNDWHPVMLFWFIGFWLQTYSLWKHRKMTN